MFKSPALTLVIVLSLAIGIGANTAIFSVVNALLLKPLPVPNAEQLAELKSEAEEQIKIAADYIEKCGYHRRDEELAELQAVLRGEKKFADLPPRV